MTASDTPVTPGAERYPGEAIDLLRSIAAEVAELRALREELAPFLDNMREGRGLVGMARAAARVRNGARQNDYPTGAPGAPGPGAGAIPPGIWGRARCTHPGP
jgi:hypothetical protein